MASQQKRLPSGWEEIQTDIGKPYYYHKETDHTQWEFPIHNAFQKTELPSGWKELKSDNGVPYYYNEESGTTQWDFPIDTGSGCALNKNDKDAMLIKAVDESDIMTVAKLLKCIHELDPEQVTIAQDIAKDKGNRSINRLMDSACKKIEENKVKVTAAISSPRPQLTNIPPPCPPPPETDSNPGDVSIDEDFYPGRIDSNDMHEDTKERDRLFQSIFAQEIKNLGGDKNNLNLRMLKFIPIYQDDENQIRRLAVGYRNYKPTKTILLVGSTGAGKTSLISSLVNVAYGVKYEDSFRIKVKEEESQTKTADQSQTEWITVYEFNHMPGMVIDYNLNIIDTPGLNDTRGLDYDKMMVDRIERVFREEKFGIEEVNCIGIVTMASATRLTDAQKYVYDGCMRMFGENVKVILHIMATFADTSDPAITAALNTAKVEYVKLHKFNNSSIYLENNPKTPFAKMNVMYWNLLEQACSQFLSVVGTTGGQSLSQSIEVLEKRRQIHNALSSSESSFKNTLNTVLSNVEKSDTVSSEQAFNCTQCKRTCHKPCYHGYYFSIVTCKTCTDLIEEGKNCQVCGCTFSTHERKNEFINSHVLRNVSKENKEDLKNYLKEIQSNLLVLKKIALQKHPVSNENYLAQLIEINKENQDTNSSRDKIAILEGLKTEEESIQALSKEGIVDELIHKSDEHDFQTGEGKLWFW